MVENRRPVGGLEWSNNPPPGGAAEYFDETPFMRSVWDQRAGAWISEGDSSIPIYSRGGLPLGLGSQQQQQPPPVKYGGSLESILRGESYL